MIRTLAVTIDSNVLYNLSLDRLKDSDIKWFWMDFEDPNEEEVSLLESYFSFHHLAIEDCLHLLQRPKFEHYDTYKFFVIHALDIKEMEVREVDIFVGEQYIVSFHLEKSHEIDSVWEKFIHHKKVYHEGPIYAAYLIMDKIVDEYFPFIDEIEEKVDELDDNVKNYSVSYLMNKVFSVRGDLLKIRRTIRSMGDLLYRILNSSDFEGFKERKFYFTDLYDHLLKLSEIIESNLDITADMRDSYLAINANRMNSIMALLTVITTIFIPLTFISGVYGMNFKYMPELAWKYGYFFILGIMGIIAVSMFYWFKRKGWFDLDK